MNSPVSTKQTTQPLYRTERVIASLTVAWVMILTTYMIFQDHALSHASIYFLKIVLSLSGGVMLATLPGFFDINYTLGGFSVRAAGGAAAFVFIYTQSPTLPAFQADPVVAPVPPHQSGGQAKPDRTSARAEGFPVLMAFAVSPASFAPTEVNYHYGAAPSGAVAQLGGYRQVGGGRRVSFGEAVQADVRALGSAIASYARTAFNKLASALDGAAMLLRSAVDAALGKVRGLLGIPDDGNGLPNTIAVFGEEELEPLDALAPLLGPSDQTLGSLLSGLSTTTTTVLEGLNGAVGGVVATADHTVNGLVSTVQATSHQLLDTTDALVGGVTGLLDETTNGLTGRLTAPVETLTSGLTEKTGNIVDTVLPKTAELTSSVLETVNSGVNGLTDRLNSVTPAIVSKLDPDFLATHSLPRLEQAALLNDVPALPDQLDAVVGKVPATIGVALPDRLQTNTLLAGRGLGGSFSENRTGETCISGCGAPLAALTGGVRDTLGGLTGHVGSRGGITVLGGGGLVGGGSSGPVGGSQEAGAGSGPIGSTLQQTGSVVRGTVQSLRRR
jgi:hypothetical protein